MATETKYKCTEPLCDWVGIEQQMKREYDFGYDQSCCPECNSVLIDNLHGETYCNAVNYLLTITTDD